MPVETAKCWWLLKIEPNAWAGGKGSCAVCVDLQAVGALEFFGELYSLAKGFGPFLRGVWAGFREREGSIFSNHQHFAVSTGICGVACPLPALRVVKPMVQSFPTSAPPPPPPPSPSKSRMANIQPAYAYPSDADVKLDITVVAIGGLPVTLPLALALSGLDNLQRLMLPAQLLQTSLQLLNAPLVCFALPLQRLLLFLLCYKPMQQEM